MKYKNVLLKDLDILSLSLFKWFTMTFFVHSFGRQIHTSYWFFFAEFHLKYVHDELYYISSLSIMLRHIQCTGIKNDYALWHYVEKRT